MRIFWDQYTDVLYEKYDEFYFRTAFKMTLNFVPDLDITFKNSSL
jgi:hypothetical protein